MAHSTTYQIDERAHIVCTEHTSDYELPRPGHTWNSMSQTEVDKFRKFWTKDLGETRDICELSDYDF